MLLVILVLSSVMTALIAGLYYGYSCSVNIGLAKLSDEAYISAMQSINREIQNPLFFLSFFGTLFLLPVCARLLYKAQGGMSFYLCLAAALFYIFGSFGVTCFGNVPLNDVLDKFDPHVASLADMARQRASFELTWNRLHGIRTGASVVSLILMILACIYYNVNDLNIKSIQAG